MNNLRVTPPIIVKHAFEIKRDRVYTLRFTPPGIDKRTFEIRRSHIYNFRLTLILVAFMLCTSTLTFMQWDNPSLFL